MSWEALATDARQGLEDLFGHGEFRSGQQEVVDRVVGGSDALVVMPTGSGKSLCYQLPACLVDGVALVVSPLIALMKDQVDQLRELGLPATLINSSITRDEQRRRIESIRHGGHKIIYVAPERFKSSGFLRALEEIDVGLFAVDEAHCISQWGHDFRPDYRRLGEVRERLGNPRTMALTATATPTVQKDILRGLGLEDAEVFVRGFERPNLKFEVYQARGHDAKEDRIVALAEHHHGESVVVYCATRKQVRNVARSLRRRGLDVAAYHGGMDDAKRAQKQDAWSSGEVPLLVATNAFGMGVDKSDVRAVIHYDMPSSLEAYYQEAGRAGRDGEPANCLLLFNFGDRGIHEFFIENSYPDAAAYRAVWTALQALGKGTQPFDSDRFAERVRGVHPMGVETILRSLRYAGYVEDGMRDGHGWVALPRPVDASELDIDWTHAASRRAIAERQLEDVVAYASTQDCRQNFIVEHFGGTPAMPTGCGTCDRCKGMPDYAREAMADMVREIRTRDDADTVLKKLLAGVARARGRFGAHAIAQMLRGANTKKMRKTSLGKLSTFGILRDLKQDDLVHLLDALARHGLTVTNEHGCVALAQIGKLVMVGDEEPPSSLQDEWDLTIVERGTGRQASRARVSIAPRGPVPGGTTYEKTLGLLNEGLSVAEVAVRRGIRERTVLDHLVLLADRGETLEIEARSDLVEALREHDNFAVGDSLRELRDALPYECSYSELKLALAVWLGEKSSTN